MTQPAMQQQDPQVQEKIALGRLFSAVKQGDLSLAFYLAADMGDAELGFLVWHKITNNEKPEEGEIFEEFKYEHPETQRTAIEIAAQNEHADFIKMALEYNIATRKYIYGAFKIAAANNGLKILEMMRHPISWNPHKEERPGHQEAMDEALHAAVESGHHEAVEFLLKKSDEIYADWNINVNALKGGKGSKADWTPICTALYGKDKKMVKLLAAAGANPEVIFTIQGDEEEDAEKKSPLEIAAIDRRDEELVEILLNDAHASPYFNDMFHKVESGPGSLDKIKEMIEQAANIEPYVLRHQIEEYLDQGPEYVRR